MRASVEVGKGVRGAGLRAAVIALALALVALALPAQASAGLYHPKPAEPPSGCVFGSNGKAGSSISSFARIALQQQSRRLYALTSAAGSLGIYGFDASAFCPAGGYPLLAAFGPLLTSTAIAGEPDIAVDDTELASQGRIYVANSTQILAFAPGGSELNAGDGFPDFPTAPTATTEVWKSVAVDPSGDLWAGDFQGAVHEFSPSGVPLQEVSTSAFLSDPPKALAFDATGDLYVAGFNAGAWKLAAPTYDAPVEIDPRSGIGAIAVDRSTGDLYVTHQKEIARYDPSGNLVEEFPASPLAGEFSGIAVDEASKSVYAYTRLGGEDDIHAFKALVLPDLATGPLGDLSETSARLTGYVHPDGVALSGCRFEWVSEAAYLESGFGDLSSGGEASCEPPFGSIPSSGTTEVSAPASGLSAGERYRFRLVGENENGTNASKPVSFSLTAPGVETIGSPIRTATTARLDARVDPHGIPTEYRFQYLTEAQYAADGQSFGAGTVTTPSQPAGSGGQIVLASANLSELEPATAYRYRVIAENEGFGEAVGEALSFATRSAAEEDLSHGPYPGPPGSDRAWEQVNLPDTSGNPVVGAAGIAASGEAAIYRVSGGTPISQLGGIFDYLYAHRPPGAHPGEGWQSEYIYPPRKAAAFSAWRPPAGDDSLSSLTALNTETEEGAGGGVWRIPTTGGTPTKLYQTPPGVVGTGFFVFSDDGRRAIKRLAGAHLDPDHTSPGGEPQLYDVASGTPRMVTLLPGAGPGAPGPECGIAGGPGIFKQPTSNYAQRSVHWITPDGSRAFFTSEGNEPCGAPHLYMRDFEEEKTVRVDGLETAPGVFGPLSGPDCPGAMIRSTDEAVYLWTQSRLAEGDTAIAGGCESSPGAFVKGGDVYRYTFATEKYKCLTCVAPGGRAANAIPGTNTEGAGPAIAVAPAGPRLYFTTASHLLPGAPDEGTTQVYRVNTETDQLAYVGPLEAGEHVGEDPYGYFEGEGTAISPNGRYLAFRSKAPGLNQLTGSDNGNSAQYYLYDDGDPAAGEGRSLSCASCPPDGSAPRGAVGKGIIGETEPSPNMTLLSDGGDLAFATPTALVPADRNTAAAGHPAYEGEDVYEWRDGRPLLVSDGLATWPSSEAVPRASTISPSGRDLFFVEAAQLTPDAIDGYPRLYDARIDGGIVFPEAKPPCSLEACQGTPKGAPAESTPGSASFAGPGNVREEAPRPRCAKGKVRRKDRCVKKAHKAKHGRQRRANHDRRAGR